MMQKVYPLLLIFAAGPALAWNAEVQISLCEDNAEAVLEKLNVSPTKEKKRKITYLETPSLELIDLGVVVRERLSAKKLERTVKLRLPSDTTVPGKWRSMEGFKCEFDVHGSQSGFTCSLEVEMDPELDHLELSENQINFIRAFRPEALPLVGDRRRIGTLKNLAYEWKDSNFDLSLEESEIAGVRFIEISSRVDEKREAEAVRFLKRVLQNGDIEICLEQTATTKKKLELMKVGN